LAALLPWEQEVSVQIWTGRILKPERVKWVEMRRLSLLMIAPFLLPYPHFFYNRQNAIFLFRKRKDSTNLEKESNYV